MNEIKISLLIAFYNKASVLELVIASLKRQSFSLFEVIICDDGSTKVEMNLALNTLKNSGLKYQYLWQKDEGFKKNRILNQGVLKARGDYLVFIDQDCILHKNFLADHWDEKKAGYIRAGRRCDLTPKISSQLKASDVESGYLEKNYWWIFWAISWMKDNNNFKAIRMTWQWLQKLFQKKKKALLGCNFGLFKSDLEKVNGFDMRYNQPTIGEDTDLEWRLNGVGVRTLPLLHMAIQYHVYHRLLDRSCANYDIFAETQKNKTFVTEHGLNQLDPNLFELEVL
jgi:GT2 family glycosyltransferase